MSGTFGSIYHYSIKNVSSMEQPLVVDKWLFTGVIAVLILKARPLGELRREAVRGHKCVSKALSSPGVRGFQLV